MALVLTILGFLWWWPLGLLMLVFFVSRRRHFCSRQSIAAGSGPMTWEHGADRWERKMARMQDRMERKMERARSRMDGVFGGRDWFAAPSSGNRAFDDYRADTLKRLEDEEREFKDFLTRLRAAKDRAEFDAFMADRRRTVESETRTEPPRAE